MRKSVQIRSSLEKEFPNRSFSQIEIDNIVRYLEYLMKWNKKMNLTGFIDHQMRFVKIILDSLAVYKFSPQDLKTYSLSGKIADLGSGAGIPGLVLALCDSTLDIHSVDSSNKKTTFQNMVRANLNLLNFHTINSRIETLMHNFTFQYAYDCILSRALTQIKELFYYGSFFLKMGGHMLLWKGENWQDELARATEFTSVFELVQTMDYNFDELGHRGTLLVFQKIL